MKTTKQRLMELAAINNPFRVNEAVDPNAPIKLEINVKAERLIDLFGGPEALGDTLTSVDKFRNFTRVVEKDLNDWLAGFQSGAEEWANDGVESGTYDDFIPY